jgi:hypothetical protein
MKSLYTLIILLISLSGFAQCIDLISITKKEFDQYYTKGDSAQYSPDFVKHGNSVKIPGIDSVYTDSSENEDGIIVYVPQGLIFGSVYVLEVGDEIMSHYRLISTDPYFDKEIIGFPYIFGNYILAIENPHTDYQVTLQLWSTKNKGKSINFQLKKELSLGKCGLYGIVASYIYNGFIYLKNNANAVSYYKIKI